MERLGPGSYLRLPERTRTRVKRWCRKERRPIANMLRALIEEALDTRDAKETGRAA